MRARTVIGQAATILLFFSSFFFQKPQIRSSGSSIRLQIKIFGGRAASFPLWNPEYPVLDLQLRILLT
jgi:hypothetical protein